MSNQNTFVRRALPEALPALRRFALSLTGQLADADDLLQSTVERALTRSPTSDDAEGLRKWLFTVCRNLWIDEVRARRVRGADQADPPDVESLSDASGRTDPAGTLALRDLERALAVLAEPQRAVLTLVAVEGFSYREAAEILDVPVGTVMSRLARARRQLVDVGSYELASRE